MLVSAWVVLQQLFVFYLAVFGLTTILSCWRKSYFLPYCQEGCYFSTGRSNVECREKQLNFSVSMVSHYTCFESQLCFLIVESFTAFQTIKSFCVEKNHYSLHNEFRAIAYPHCFRAISISVRSHLCDVFCFFLLYNVASNYPQ